MNKKVMFILHECACWCGVTALAASLTWLFLLMLGLYSLADGGTDSCARMAAAILRACVSPFIK